MLFMIDRDLQRISGNHTARVGFLSTQEINELNQSPKILDDQKVATIEDALMMVSNSVRKVIVDAKVGPPLYEKGLAERIIAAVRRTRCANCVVWAKSDTLVRDITRLAPDTSVTLPSFQKFMYTIYIIAMYCCIFRYSNQSTLVNFPRQRWWWCCCRMICCV